MPDDRRFSDEEMEQSLRDLGARMEYPTTPDVASTVRRKLDEEERSPESRRTLRWPTFLAPRWTAIAAALVVICIVALSPTLRSTLSGPFAPQAGSEAGSAAKPEGGASEDRYKQGAKGAPQEAGPPAPGKPEAATPCPSPAIEAVPSRAAAGEKFRLHGHDFFSNCGGEKPSSDVKILFRQDGRTWRLTTLDAGRDLALESTLRVPAGAEPGPARVQAVLRSGERAEERFVVLDYQR
jgi:hypothetical protein